MGDLSTEIVPTKIVLTENIPTEIVQTEFIPGMFFSCMTQYLDTMAGHIFSCEFS